MSVSYTMFQQGTSFRGNYAKVSGGAVYSDLQSSYFYVFSSIFANNTAGTGDGGVSPFPSLPI
jgi:predicted outer membrane repeat protein